MARELHLSKVYIGRATILTIMHSLWITERKHNFFVSELVLALTELGKK